MADSITEQADDLADGVAAAGRKAGANARRTGASVADGVERASSKGASAIRRGGRQGSVAYRDASTEIDGRVSSIEESIRENPIAAVAAAAVVGLFLGRFVL